MWFIGFEVEQETSAPPPKKDPGSAPEFKLVTNAQESKMFKSNVTSVKIKCSNNFPRRYSVEITYTSLE